MSLTDELVLVPMSFSVPDKLVPFSELVKFSSSAAAWEISLPNESDSGDVTDVEEKNLSWLPNDYSDGTDSSVAGGAADSLEASKAAGSSVGLYLGIFWRFHPHHFFFNYDIVTVL